jgi:hypothetical protein
MEREGTSGAGWRILARVQWVLAVIAAISVSVWVHAPSLDAGFRADDYVQGAMLRGTFPSARTSHDLFNFTSGDDEDRARLIDFGYLPWWTADDVSLRMWRPLASALLAFDHQHFGWRATPMHVHSLLWLAALLCAAMLLLKAVLPWPACVLALLAFAVHPAHSVPVVWLANRSTLVATTLGLLSVAAYVRFRTRGHARYAVAATLFAVAAVAAGEYALTALAYAVAYELTRSDRPLRARLRLLLPVAVPALAYVALHSALGADVVGSGFYISPVRAPLQFVHAVFTRVPVLVADLVFNVPASYYMLGGPPLKQWVLSQGWFSPTTWHAFPDWPAVHVVIGYIAVLSVACVARLSLRACDVDRRRDVAFLGLGALLALLPTAGSLPGDRLLCASAFGTCAVLGLALHGLWRARRMAPWFGAALLCVFYVGCAGERAARQTAFLAAESESLRVWSLHAELPRRHAAQTRVYVLGSADFTTSANLPWVRHAHGLPLARSYRRLSPAPAAFDVTRVDPHTLDIRVLSHEASGNAVPSLYRDADHPLHAGERFSMPGLVVDVVRVHHGNPMHMRFRFDESVDDEGLWFLHSTLTGLRRLRMPAIGATLRLPRPVTVNLRASGLVAPGSYAE